jgi:hypothetical protein
MFDLLSVPWWFFKSLDEKWGSTRDNIYFGLSVLYSQFDCNLQTFPFFELDVYFNYKYFGYWQYISYELDTSRSEEI